MAHEPITKRVTVHDVAREAGVSLATVDRVLNNRSGVRERTKQRVEMAITNIGFKRDVTASLLARAQDIKLHFILPKGSNQFMSGLAATLNQQADRASAERTMINTRFVPPFDGSALAKVLDDLDPSDCDCAIIVATDSAETREAVENANARGIAIVTLVSDLPGTSRRHFVGIDNYAAGRTAASLMGRFCGGSGVVGLVVGALTLDDHRARYEGFRDVINAEFPEIDLTEPVEGFDDHGKTELCVQTLLDANPQLVGIYSMGAGNAGLIRALDHKRDGLEPKVIVHELTDSTRDALISGRVDVVIDQNPEGEIRAAIAMARQIAMRAETDFSAPPIEIGIFLRDNLR